MREFNKGDEVCHCILKQLSGRGSYGEVWLAEDPVGATVALKIIANHGSVSDREITGLKNYKECNHPNLLKVRYVEITPEYIFYTMDAADNLDKSGETYVPDSLANRLSRFGRLDGVEVVAMVNGLLDGLEELHKKGLVHRDIKPDNILWVDGRPTLADAGLIAASGKGSLVGTIGFLSPRIIEGNGGAEASDDFFALGKVIYCAVTGNPVTKYPSIPLDVTISMDIHLGHAYREACKRPVCSAEEFRKLLTETPRKKRGALWYTLLAVAVLSVIAGFALPFFKASAAVPFSPYLKDCDSTLTHYEFMQERSNLIRFMVRFAPLGKEDLIQRVLHGQRDPRLVVYASLSGIVYDNKDISSNRDALTQAQKANELCHLSALDLSLSGLLDKGSATDLFEGEKEIAPDFSAEKKPTAVEERVAAILRENYMEIDMKTVRGRETFWGAQFSGMEKEFVKDMEQKIHDIQLNALKTDPVMRYIALDMLIHHTINYHLHRDAITPKEEADLRQLIRVQAAQIQQASH